MLFLNKEGCLALALALCTASTTARATLHKDHAARLIAVAVARNKSKIKQ
jgi:hypothetical protein